MTQTLRQRTGLKQLLAPAHRHTPYTRGISAKSIIAKIDRKARAEANRAQMLLTARNIAQRTRRAWLACAPWIAALGIIAAISLAQIADDRAARIQTLTSERAALIAVNQPGAKVTIEASSIGALATTARHMANAMEADSMQQPKHNPKRVRGEGAE